MAIFYANANVLGLFKSWENFNMSNDMHATKIKLTVCSEYEAAKR